MKHKHAELIHAWADGAEIQYYDVRDNKWKDIPEPHWCAVDDYRIKPKDIVHKLHYGLNNNSVLCYQGKIPNVKFVFDSETYKLKSVEMI